MRTAEKLAGDIAVYIDKNGTVTSKRSDPFASHLSMEHDVGDIRMALVANCSPYGNGSFWVQVQRADTVLFEASGPYARTLVANEVKTHDPELNDALKVVGLTG